MKKALNVVILFTLLLVSFAVVNQQLHASNQPPIGSLDSPADGAVVAGSVALTGWALDDNGVSQVSLYYEQKGDRVYIGNALFVEGARPDVAEMYPTYPDNTSVATALQCRGEIC